MRRTLPLAPEQAWARVESIVAALGEVTSVTPGRVMRVRHPVGGRSSTVQLRVLDAPGGTTVALHHEGLPDARAREAMRERWTALLESLRP